MSGPPGKAGHEPVERTRPVFVDRTVSSAIRQSGITPEQLEFLRQSGLDITEKTKTTTTTPMEDLLSSREKWYKKFTNVD